ncbi:MAG TPA: hypothetical protein VGR73_09370 [Bryobacteraceae bacterium]|nr:hypothetical protein [Bryobacteraceae bacterium]
MLSTPPAAGSNFRSTMPEGNGKDADAQQPLDLTSASSDPERSATPTPTIPPVLPPRTSAPFQFNQQVNIQQIPPKVWDKLTPDQIFELSRKIIDQVEVMDKRQFDIA